LDSSPLFHSTNQHQQIPVHPAPNWLNTLSPTRSVSARGDRRSLEKLPTKACVELTRRLLSTAFSLPVGEARMRAVLKTVILFIAEYGCAA
jgi:hypothetical protein